MEKIAIKNLSVSGNSNYYISDNYPVIFYGANQRPFRLNGGAEFNGLLLGQIDVLNSFGGNTLPFDFRLSQEALKIYTSFVQDGVDNFCPLRLEIRGEDTGLIATETQIVYENSRSTFYFGEETIPRGERIFLRFLSQGGGTSGIDIETWCLNVIPV